ncbi:hypothetical protein F5884DRAFT_829694 [Xylogone sp. PMI_703]|nr:hypothetical protein F5884DRAFT_829694 [Xylogone sp. PMI_703]
MPPKASDDFGSRDESSSSSLVAARTNSPTVSIKREAEDEPEIKTEEQETTVVAGIGGKMEELGDDELVTQIKKLALEKEPELALLKLMETSTFSFPRFKELLTGKLIHSLKSGLNLSFSRVQYHQIAPKIGLLTFRRGDDMQTFNMYYARLPKEVFTKIIEDIEVLGKQYGTTDLIDGEEARARYLTAYFNRIVAMFGGMISNTPEALIEGRLTTNGRIVYQFKIYGGISVVFIQVKPKSGSKAERLDFLAQSLQNVKVKIKIIISWLFISANTLYIACSWVNNQEGFKMPILGILCAGECCYFFRYTSRYIGDNTPQIFIGKFSGGGTGIQIEAPVTQHGWGCRAHILRIRRTCEALYYVFLQSYLDGLNANRKRSVQIGKSDRKEWRSTRGWVTARDKGEAALTAAVIGWDKYADGEPDVSEEFANLAVEWLHESVDSAPHGKVVVFPGFTQDMIDRT